MRILLAGTALAVSLSTGASAITFDFFNSGDQGGKSIELDVHGLGLTVTPGFKKDGQAKSGGYGVSMHQGHGLGVKTVGWDSHLVDGSGRRDAAIFSFSEDVAVKSVTFSARYWDRNDDFTLYAGDDLAAIGSTDVPGRWADYTYVFQGNYEGDVFALGTSDRWDEWKIKSLYVEKVAPVPVPATLPLLAGALGLGAVALRRRKS